MRLHNCSPSYSGLKRQYAERYNFRITYENNEGELNKVQADRYSYIELLSDMYKLFNLNVDFIAIVARNGLSVESDGDLTGMFELYKDNSMVPLRITSQFVPPNMRCHLR